MRDQETQGSRPALSLLFVRHPESVLMDPDGFQKHRKDQVGCKDRINDLAPPHISHIGAQIPHGDTIQQVRGKPEGQQLPEPAFHQPEAKQGEQDRRQDKDHPAEE